MLIVFKNHVYVTAEKAGERIVKQKRNLKEFGIPDPEDLAKLMKDQERSSPGFLRGILRQVASSLKSMGAEFVGDLSSPDFHVSLVDEAGDLIIAPTEDMKTISVEWIGYDGRQKTLGTYEVSRSSNFREIGDFIKRVMKRAGSYMRRSAPQELEI